MRVRPFILPVLAAVVVLAGPLLGYQAATRAAARKTHEVYRLDYAINVTEPGKPTATSNYALNVEEGSTGDLHAGANVPLQTSSGSSMASPRQDVGVKIHCRLARAGDDLVLHSSEEMSGADERTEPGPRAIRKISANDDVVVAPGKTALVARIEEPVSHARYEELTVTATKLR